MKIKFCIPESQTIPTRLRLKVDEKYDVYYERRTAAFAYTFEFFKSQGVTEELATEITNEIVRRMISQSYDHGAQWRECFSREVESDEYNICITVYFRVRDAW